VRSWLVEIKSVDYLGLVVVVVLEVILVLLVFGMVLLVLVLVVLEVVLNFLVNIIEIIELIVLCPDEFVEDAQIRILVAHAKTPRPAAAGRRGGVLNLNYSVAANMMLLPICPEISVA
jgi:hypothetical protein